MKLTTLCYIEQNDNYLMLHRVKKENDLNHDKWIGVGGKFEPDETPEECLLREVKEETGLTLLSYRARGIITFISDEWETEYMYLYTASEFEGEMTECDEGELVWVPKAEVEDLKLWEGDTIFLRLLRECDSFFSLKVRYEGERLAESKVIVHCTKTRSETVMNQNDSIYGNHRPQLEATMRDLSDRIERLRKDMNQRNGMDPVEHILTRIKSEESMREKCRRNHLPETTESALWEIHDAIGLRIVCVFLDDVYAIRDYLAGFQDITIIQEKDYIRNAKPNGYRSYHLILQMENRYYAEIQLRTISMDTWAALEHHLKYKKKIGGNEKLILEELKRCADELASTDVSIQTIRNLIFEEEPNA